MQESGLQGNQAISSQLDLLSDCTLLPIPEGQSVPIRAGNIGWIEALHAEIA